MSAIIRTAKDRALLAKWNKKLEKYNDCNAENYKYEDPKLKHWDNFHFKRIPKEIYESKQLYFSNARELAQNGKFKSMLSKKIWELHSEGFSLREIVKAINERYKKDTVNKIIKDIVKEQMPK